MNKYAYQEQIAIEALDTVLKTGKVLIAAACGAGKTTISHHMINRFVKNHQGAKVLVITENNKALKNQYLDGLNNPNVPIEFTFSDAREQKNAQVSVAIASGLKHLQETSFDMVIIDESHRYYSEKMVQSFLKTVNPAYLVLFTGTPSKFIKEAESDELQSQIVFISGSELQGVYSSIEMDIIRSRDKSDPEIALDEFLNTAKTRNSSLEKVLMVCPSIDYAQSISSTLHQRGYKSFLSTSKNDSDGKILAESKSSSVGFVITVGRASLGYDDPSIMTLVDFRSSLSSLDNNQQIFARLLRRSQCGSTKTYYRVSHLDAKNYNKNVIMLHKLRAYMDRQIFTSFNQHNLKVDIGNRQNQIKVGTVGYAYRCRQNRPKVAA